MLRAMRAVASGRGRSGSSDAMMDLHCGNRWPSGKGEIDVLEYAQHMSLMNSTMFGEGFDDGGTHTCANRSSGKCGDADWMLLATSGLQFGVMNDMLTDINVFRGMVFGMWARPPYSSLEQNHHLWNFVDSSGISANDTQMLGYWADEHDWHSVVTSSVPAVKVTAYLVQPNPTAIAAHGGGGGQLIIACASWAADAVTVSFTLDHAALGAKIRGWDSNPSTKLEVVAPSIPMVQQRQGSRSLERWTVGARSGVLLTVRQLKTDDALRAPSQPHVATAAATTAPGSNPAATAEYFITDNHAWHNISGTIDVTKAPFGADHTGADDATQAELLETAPPPSLMF